MIKNDEDSYVLEGHPVLLICGYNLNSNPGARVIWTNPNGEQVANGNDYVIDEDLLVVQLNITKTKRKDNGTWKCKVMNNANNFYSKTLEVDLRLTVVGEFMLVSVIAKLHVLSFFCINNSSRSSKQTQ